jgi:hypothetical protein
MTTEQNIADNAMYESGRPLPAALSSTTLMRWGGLAAVLAGVLRAAVSFSPSSDPAIALELLYLLIDVLILFGILGVYGFLGEQSGVAGFLGFLLAVIGTAIITGSDGEIGEVDMYAAGSAVLAIGLGFLAVGLWKAQVGCRIGYRFSRSLPQS